MVALVELVTQEPCDVKLDYTVAKMEAKKTNSFLQLLFRADTSGIDSIPYVKEILGVEVEKEEDGLK